MDQDRDTSEIELLSDGDAQRILPYDADDSPFPEVRAVVSPIDDASLPVNTVRMWTIGIVFTIVRPSGVLMIPSPGAKWLIDVELDNIGGQWTQSILQFATAECHH